LKVILIFLSMFFFQCIAYSNYEYIFEDENSYNIIPFWEETLPINTAAPEEELFYTAEGVRFNWARDNVPYFTILISQIPLETNGSEITNQEVILAGSDSSYTESDKNSMGYLGPTAFSIYFNGNKTSEPFVFTSGTYYWLVLGFDEAGELTHSSRQTKFYIH